MTRGPVYGSRHAETPLAPNAAQPVVPVLAPVGSATYACDDAPGSEVTASFFATDPPTAIAEHGDEVSFMVAQPAASGARYQGRNESLWEHQGVATVTWGYGAPELHCCVRP